MHLRFFFSVLCRNGSLAIFCRDLSLLHDQGYLVHLILVVAIGCKPSEGRVVAPYYLISCSVTAYILVAHTETYHVNAHISRGLVWVFSVYALENGVEYWENVYVPVVIDRDLVIGFQMERVNHIKVIKIGCCGFVSKVYRVFKRKIPYRECLKLGIACLDVALVFMIELTQTYCHLSTAWTWSCNNYKRT